MTLHRFFVLPDAIADGGVALSGGQSRQVARVLRLRQGDRIVVLDGGGQDYVVELDSVDPQLTRGMVVSTSPSRGESPLAVTLYQALLPRERFETVLEKGTEAGISRFVPTVAERCLPGSFVSEERLGRWRRLVQESAEQSERGVVPEVLAPLAFKRGLAIATEAGPTLLAWERGTDTDPRDTLAALPEQGAVSIFVGPEGGFSPDEVELARHAGALAVTLGPRILRSETAGPLLAALVQYASGNLRTSSG